MIDLTKMDLKRYEWIAQILLLIGGVNWLFVGLLGVDLVSAILGNFIGRLAFIIVGLAAVFDIYLMYQEKVKSRA